MHTGYMRGASIQPDAVGVAYHTLQACTQGVDNGEGPSSQRLVVGVVTGRRPRGGLYGAGCKDQAAVLPAASFKENLILS